MATIERTHAGSQRPQPSMTPFERQLPQSLDAEKIGSGQHLVAAGSF